MYVRARGRYGAARAALLGLVLPTWLMFCSRLDGLSCGGHVLEEGVNWRDFSVSEERPALWQTKVQTFVAATPGRERGDGLLSLELLSLEPQMSPGVLWMG
jgi:hypothetical protein